MDVHEIVVQVPMEGRPQKLARLQALRDRLPYISQSALAAVLKISQHEQLPLADRKDIIHARDLISKTATPYGAITQIIKVPCASGGDDIQVEVQNPFAMLYHCCSTSNAMSALVKRVHEKKPGTLSTPWNMILYTDEITPGNQLGYKSQRKLWAIYWSVLEWGPEALSDEDRHQHASQLPHDVASMHASAAAARRNILS